MTTISVPDMMCENCVKRITNALTEAELKFTVSLPDKTVTIDGCQHCVQTAMEELEDLGFTPEMQKQVTDSRLSCKNRPCICPLDTGTIFYRLSLPLCYYLIFSVNHFQRFYVHFCPKWGVRILISP